MKKGSLAGVEGRIQTGSFEGQDGKRVYTTEVVADSVQFLEPRSSSSERQPRWTTIWWWTTTAKFNIQHISKTNQ